MSDQDIYSGIFGSGVGLSLAPRSNVSGVFFSGTGSQTVFSFPSDQQIISDSPHSYDIVIHGVGQVPVDDYSVNVSANTITFAEAPPAGTRNIYVRIITQAVSESETPTVTLGDILTPVPGNDDVPGLLGINGPINTPIQALLNRIAAISNSPVFLTVNSLQSYTGSATTCLIYAQGLAGQFYIDSLDTATLDDGKFTIIDANGRRWKRAYHGGKVDYGTAAPTSGTWAQGDTVVNTAPTELGTVGSKYVVDKWRCVTAGNPGTWVQLRSLTGN